MRFACEPISHVPGPARALGMYASRIAFQLESSSVNSWARGAERRQIPPDGPVQPSALSRRCKSFFQFARLPPAESRPGVAAVSVFLRMPRARDGLFCCPVEATQSPRTVLIHSRPSPESPWTSIALTPTDSKDPHFPDAVWRVSWSLAGNILAVSCGDGKISLWKEGVGRGWECVSDFAS